MDAPKDTPISFQQGADVEFIFPPVAYTATGLNVDYTGFTARMHIRENADAPLIGTELNTTNGGIVITGSQVKLVLTNAQTSALDFGSDYAAQYDMELIQPGTGYVFKPYHGPITMIPETTR